MSEELFETKQDKLTRVTPRELIVKYIRYLPWLAISVALLLMLAYVQLRYSTPIFNVSGKLLVKNPNPYGNNGDKFDDIFMMQTGNRNLNDEMEIIRSRYMAQRVVIALGLQKMCYNKGNIRSSLIHPQEIPFNVEIISLKDSSHGFNWPIFILNEKEYQIGEKSKPVYFGQVIERPEGTFQISRNRNSYKVFASNQFIFSWQPAVNRAGGIGSGLRIAPAVDLSSILQLTYETENPRLGKDIVDQYMKEYQQSSLEDKKQIAVNTLSFIEDQLIAVRQDLGSVERNLQNYREQNGVFNTEAQTQRAFGDISDLTRQITELEIKTRIIDFLIKYISDQGNHFRIVPTTLDIADPSLLQSIGEYNRLQLEHTTYITTTPRTNPAVLDLENAIEKLRGDMIQNLRNIRQTYVVASNELNLKNNELANAIRSIPGKEKQMLDKKREQQILQELYSYLLQKKLETSISSASTISNIKVVEPAVFSNYPIKPNRRSLYLLAIALGVLIPVGIIFLLEYLNDKVKTRIDVEKATDAPIVGEVGHSDMPGSLVVMKNNRKFIAEQFRMIRTNFQYVLMNVENPVILVTSTFSGEGKSFISTNLGAVIAVSGRRTVILEFDIRKPKILKGLGLHEKKGITNFIVGNIPVEEIIYPVPDAENLFVIPCGPVPPNPAEMLLNEKISQLFALLRTRFETIIIDSAPAGLVSDAITLGKFADATMYIIRYNYTFKKQVQLIEDINRNKKLPKLSLIINDVYTKSTYGSYYGYGSYYAYGYGYAYGSGYFEEGKKKKSWLSIFKFWS